MASAYALEIKNNLDVVIHWMWGRVEMPHRQLHIGNWNLEVDVVWKEDVSI